MIQLFNADCLDKMKDISSNSIDLIVCDLPFGCLEQQKRSEESIKKYNRARESGVVNGCSWDIKIDLEAFWKEVKRIRKDDHTPCLHFCTTKYGFELWESNKKEFRYDLVWDKQRGVSFLSANKMPLRSHEMIYVFSKAGAHYKRIDIDAPGKPKRTDDVTKPRSANYLANPKLHRSTGADENKACIKSVIPLVKVGTFKQGHPTEKPLELYKFLIERYCPAGGTVLDPTFGSGNSGLAAKELGLNYIGIEKNKEFFEKGKEKIYGSV